MTAHSQSDTRPSLQRAGVGWPEARGGGSGSTFGRVPVKGEGHKSEILEPDFRENEINFGTSIMLSCT